METFSWNILAEATLPSEHQVTARNLRTENGEIQLQPWFPTVDGEQKAISQNFSPFEIAINSMRIYTGIAKVRPFAAWHVPRYMFYTCLNSSSRLSRRTSSELLSSPDRLRSEGKDHERGPQVKKVSKAGSDKTLWSERRLGVMEACV